jgi:small subunit ribosomal protein S20
MANIKSSKKRAIQAAKLNAHNSARKSRIRTLTKKVHTAVEEKNLEAAKTVFAELVPLLDRAACKNLLNKNTVARNKSKLNASIKAIA